MATITLPRCLQRFVGHTHISTPRGQETAPGPQQALGDQWTGHCLLTLTQLLILSASLSFPKDKGAGLQFSAGLECDDNMNC